ADPDGAAAELAELVGGKPEDVLRISAKTGKGVAEVLDAIVERVTAPSGDPGAPARRLSSTPPTTNTAASLPSSASSTARSPGVSRCARWRRERASRPRRSGSSRRR